MSRVPGQRIMAVLIAIDRWQRYVEVLDGDPSLIEMAEDASEPNLQIIGEAVNHLPVEITDAHPEIAWRRSGVPQYSRPPTLRGRRRHRPRRRDDPPSASGCSFARPHHDWLRAVDLHGLENGCGNVFRAIGGRAR